MNAILSFVMSIINPVIDNGLTVANKLPQGVENGAALLIFFFLLFIVVIFGMALKGRTGAW